MKINPNLRHLIKSEQSKRGSILEGSSRSGKTFSGVDNVIRLCAKHDGITINIIRETYQSFKTTLYDDFNRRLPDFGIVSPFIDRQELGQFRLFGNRVNLLGADKPSKFHGASCDYAWFNEMMDIPQGVFDQQEQRTRKYWWGDYNPKYTQHWIYDAVLKRPDVSYIHTTFKDNPFISEPEKAKILGYEMTPENLQSGTANEYMWKVYGRGERGDIKGRIFKNIKYIDRWPEGMAYWYGMDFGFTVDPTAIVRLNDDGTTLTAELLFYDPVPSPIQLSDAMDGTGIDRYTPITADSADKYTAENKGSVQMVRDLRDLGWSIDKVSKTKGLSYWLQKMNERRIVIVRNDNFIKELENYRWKEINGITIEQPCDGHDHAIDALRYGFMAAYKNDPMW